MARVKVKVRVRVRVRSDPIFCWGVLHKYCIRTAKRLLFILLLVI